jgi:ATP-dependent DNA ligase
MPGFGDRHAAKALPVRLALIEGGAVVEVNGMASFSALQAALGAREGPCHKAAARPCSTPSTCCT